MPCEYLPCVHQAGYITRLGQFGWPASWLSIVLGTLTLKQLRHFFLNANSFANIVPYNCNIVVQNWSNIMNIQSALWILMACSTRASVATVLSTHWCVSSCLWVNTQRLRQNGCHLADDIFKNIFLLKNCFKFHLSLLWRIKSIINW